MLSLLAVVLIAAVGLGLLARRFGLPALVGELLAGVVLGPSVFGYVWPDASERLLGSDPANSPALSAVSTLGVLLLVGLAATELDEEFLKRRAAAVGSISAFGFAIPLLAGIGVGLLVPQQFHGLDSANVEFVLLLGVALSVSAIPVITRILVDLDLLKRDIGQLTLASCAVTDMGAWVVLAAVSALATVGISGGQFPLTIAAMIGVLVFTWLVRPWVRRGLDRLEASSHGGYTSAAVVVLIIAGGAATDAMHLEAALGAFLAGILVGKRGGGVLAPLQSVTTTVLAPVFLAGAGLHLDVTDLGDPQTLMWGAVVLLVAIVAKFAAAYLGARIGGLAHWEAASLGAGLNARGAVEIIIATVGLNLGIFSPQVYMVVVLLALATSIMAGPMLIYTTRRTEQVEAIESNQHI
ncbi:putative antiporter [Gordonia effusa NBRC 100432]|uniref:Putative antiporter n=1 Tax=Gordonia effusa NBRC 100432 TaxID=1077974 RepID=H0R691_9ACTN|nr:cation:proton antiporter [Gordonia effusa]GAB20592.1 putative antiporter [Gordonia effusa NBRC 100432]